MTQCLFCDKTKLTKEHLWPDWIVQMFPKNVPYTAGRASPEMRLFHEWPTNSLKQTARIVCKQCNTGWMSEIESLASPILKPCILDVTQRRTFTDLEFARLPYGQACDPLCLTLRVPLLRPRVFLDT